MPFYLKRTVTETFDVNLDALDPMYPIVSSESLDRILGRGGGALAREAEEWIVQQFELHDGSQYGDKLFSSRADTDQGIELLWEDD